MLDGRAWNDLRRLREVGAWMSRRTYKDLGILPFSSPNHRPGATCPLTRLFCCPKHQYPRRSSPTEMIMHIMIDLASRHPSRETVDMPPGAVYDPARGYWVKDGKPMVMNPAYRSATKSTTSKPART